MQYQGMTLCDFCFSRIETEGVCPHCGLSHQNYTHEVGILPPGTNLDGKYIIGRLLGRGGFGATYLAFSSERNCVVAIKEYFPAGISTRGRGEVNVTVLSRDKQEVFKKGATKLYEEAQTVFRFNTCKNIVSVFEFFYANATVYFAMEYLEGIDLKNYIQKKGGRISEPELVKVIQGMCEALKVVHGADTLHRDISPDNIMICTDGEVKLFDFGSAKQVVNEEANRNYSVVVKQGFAPAEQYTAKGKQGPWTDLYAVGATMYYALTGQIPPDAMSRYDTPDIVFHPAYGISPGIARIIDKCMKLRIEDRYQSAEELLADINALGIAADMVGGEEYVNEYDNTAGVAGQSEGIDIGEIDFGNPSQLVNSNPSEYRMRLVADKKAAESSGFFKGLMLGMSLAAFILTAMIAVLLILGNNPFEKDETPQQPTIPNTVTALTNENNDFVQQYNFN